MQGKCAFSKIEYDINYYFTISSAAQMPAKYRKNKTKPRGVSNRNRGLDWIRANATSGVIFFADDDNSYDVTLFEQVSVKTQPLTSDGANHTLLFHGRCGTRGKSPCSPWA